MSIIGSVCNSKKQQLLRFHKVTPPPLGAFQRQKCLLRFLLPTEPIHAFTPPLDLWNSCPRSITQMFPRLRVFLFDAHRVFSSPGGIAKLFSLHDQAIATS